MQVIREWYREDTLIAANPAEPLAQRSLIDPQIRRVDEKAEPLFTGSHYVVEHRGPVSGGHTVGVEINTWIRAVSWEDGEKALL